MHVQMYVVMAIFIRFASFIPVRCWNVLVLTCSVVLLLSLCMRLCSPNNSSVPEDDDSPVRNKDVVELVHISTDRLLNRCVYVCVCVYMCHHYGNHMYLTTCLHTYHSEGRRVLIAITIAIAIA